MCLVDTLDMDERRKGEREDVWNEQRTSLNTGIINQNDLVNVFDWTAKDNTGQRSEQCRIALVVKDDNNRRGWQIIGKLMRSTPEYACQSR